MSISVSEAIGRAELLAQDIERVIRAHTDSLDPRSLEQVSAMGVSHALAGVVVAMAERAGVTRTPEQVVGSILRMPWKTTVDVVMDRRRQARIPP